MEKLARVERRGVNPLCLKKDADRHDIAHLIVHTRAGGVEDRLVIVSIGKRAELICAFCTFFCINIVKLFHCILNNRSQIGALQHVKNRKYHLINSRKDRQKGWRGIRRLILIEHNLVRNAYRLLRKHGKRNGARTFLLCDTAGFHRFGCRAGIRV